VHSLLGTETLPSRISIDKQCQIKYARLKNLTISGVQRQSLLQRAKFDCPFVVCAVGLSSAFAPIARQCGAA
jgi:hypothetical protein